MTVGIIARQGAEYQVWTVACAQQWRAVETTVADAVAVVPAAAGVGALPHQIAVEAVELHKMALATLALLVHFAAGI